MRHNQQPKSRTRPQPQKVEKQSEEEVLREQAMTETEKHPYLDTEGGE